MPFALFSPSRSVLTLLLVLVLGLASTSLVAAQDVDLRVSYTYGTFAMNAVGDAQMQRRDVLREEFNVSAAVVDRYPDRPSLRADLVFLVDGPWQGGVSGGYTSTGGRISYVDATGSLTVDETVSRWYLGGFVERVVVSPASGINLLAGTHLRLMTSTRSETRRLSVNDAELPEPQEALSRTTSAPGLGIVPEVAVEANWRRFAFRTHVGYEWTMQRRTIDYNVRASETPQGPKVKWDGMRVGVAVGTRLF